MLKVSFRETLEKLDADLAYCSSIKVDVTQSRFIEHRELIASLLPAIEKRSLPDDHDQERAISASVEAIELTDICMPFIRTLPLAVQQYKLRRMMRGPGLAREESADDGTNDPRNTQFEINLAAKLFAGGLDPHFEEPDLGCQLSTGRGLIACKRPFHAPSIGANAEKARRQLMDQIRNDDSARGAIALSLTRIAVPHGGVLRVASESQITPSLERTIMKHILDRHAWSPSLDPTAIGGWMFHIAAMAEIEDQHMFAFAELTLNFLIAPEESEAHTAFVELVRGLDRATTQPDLTPSR